MMRKYEGFSLIEMLCALSIGMIILLVVVNFYVYEQKMQRLMLSLSAMQMDARFVGYILRRPIGMAGFLGCSNLKEISLVNLDAKKSWQIYHSEQSNLPSMLKSLRAKNNTDMLVVRYMDPITARLKMKINNNHKIVIGLMPRFKKNDVVVVSDCHHAVLSHLQRISVSKKKRTQKLFLNNLITSTFSITSEVGAWHETVFFVGRNNTLYRSDNAARRMPLISGVENMRLHVIKKRGFVIGITIHLLLRSAKDVLSSPKSCSFEHKKYGVHSRRLYRDFRVTIPLMESFS